MYNSVILLALLATPALSFLINGHQMALARIDPIVSPGIVSSHVHAVVGGSAFNVNYDPLEYRNASCTSIETPVDKSNYWMPAVYGRSGNTFSALPVREIRIYYFTEGSVAFPENFRMLAGSPMSRAAGPNMIWYCQQGSHGDDPNSLGRNSRFPVEKCWDFLRSEITFPNCWTGNTSVVDTSTQTSYMLAGSKCPATHPVKLPKIVLEFGYNSSSFDPNSLVLANGDTTGYGLHGDFAMGWDRNQLQALIDDENCNARQSPFGGDSPCSVLKDHQDKAASAKCHMTADIPLEEVGIVKPITALPGCNPLWTGNSTKPTCDSSHPADPKLGRPTRVFESYGASYVGFEPNLLPVYDPAATTSKTAQATGRMKRRHQGRRGLHNSV